MRSNTVRYRGSKFLDFYQAVSVRCLFGPTKYRYKHTLYVLHLVRLHQLLPLLPLKNILPLLLKLNEFFGELLLSDVVFYGSLLRKQYGTVHQHGSIALF